METRAPSSGGRKPCPAGWPVAAAIALSLGWAGIATAQSHLDPKTASPSQGRLEGTVTLASRLVARNMSFSLYPDAHRAKIEPGRRTLEHEMSNVVVYLESVPEAASSSSDNPSSMEQRYLSFHPHVLPIVRGTTVEFPNRDTIYHNVFSLSKAAKFDLGRYPSGASKSVQFEESGMVKVFCHIHSDMSAVILVLDNPYFATPDSDGRFVIEGVPPGTYRIAAWHERARLSVKKATIEAGGVATLDFDIPLAEVPEGD